MSGLHTAEALCGCSRMSCHIVLQAVFPQSFHSCTNRSGALSSEPLPQSWHAL